MISLLQLAPPGGRVSELLTQRERFSQPSEGMLPAHQGPKVTCSDFPSMTASCLMPLVGPKR